MEWKAEVWRRFSWIEVSLEKENEKTRKKLSDRRKGKKEPPKETKESLREATELTPNLQHRKTRRLVSLPSGFLPFSLSLSPSRSMFDDSDDFIESWCTVCDKQILQPRSSLATLTSSSSLASSSTATTTKNATTSEGGYKKPPGKYIAPKPPTFKRSKTGTIRVSRGWPLQLFLE